MFEYPTEQRIESALIPGVTFTIYSPSYARRMAFDRAIAEFKAETRLINRQFQTMRAKAEELRRTWKRAGGEDRVKAIEAIIAECVDAEELSSLNEDLAAAQFKLPDEITDELDELNERSSLSLVTKHNAPRLRIYLKNVEGLIIGGKEATVDSLLSDGPPELFAEILNAIDATSDGMEALIKNLQLPSTSSDPVAGKTTSTIATVVSGAAGTNPGPMDPAAGTADAISPTT